MKSSVFRICAIAAVLSAVTTLGIHAYFIGPATFEEAMEMYKTTYYLVSKWWVIGHCILVIISVFGLYYYLNNRQAPFALLGFTFYAAFGITEIFRMLLILEYISRLRDQYLISVDTLRDLIKVSLDQMSGIGQMLFIAFTIFIILGNLFLGLSSLGEKPVRTIGTLLLMWSAVLIISLVNEYAQNEWVTTFMHYFSLTIQPLIRVWLGVVLFRLSKDPRVAQVPAVG